MVGFETLLALLPKVRVVHHIPGRIRLKLVDLELPSAARLPERGALRKVDDIAARIPGVRSLRLNPLARSCAVEYDPRIIPEQAWGDQIDYRSDIFAVGVLLFELTTGKRLFKGASEFETLKLIVDKEYPRPSQVKPGFPAALDRIIMKALEKKRESRYQSAREMQMDLEAFVREERIPVSQISMTQWMQSLFQDKLEQQKEALQDVKS